MKEMLKIKQATSKGYAEVAWGGVFDAAYPHSELRRGRVQGNYGDICPALATTMILYVYEGYEEY